MSHPFPEEDDGDESRLEHYAFQMGPRRAKLALAMDLLTDAIIVLGQHKVYSHPATGKEKRDRDIEAALNHLTHVKTLLAGALEK